MRKHAIVRRQATAQFDSAYVPPEPTRPNVKQDLPTNEWQWSPNWQSASTKISEKFSVERDRWEIFRDSQASEVADPHFNAKIHDIATGDVIAKFAPKAKVEFLTVFPVINQMSTGIRLQVPGHDIIEEIFTQLRMLADNGYIAYDIYTRFGAQDNIIDNPELCYLQV